MKSPMLQLIEQLEKTIPSIKNENAIDKNFWLLMEKEELCNFWTNGNQEGWDMTTAWENAVSYFDSTFEENASQLTTKTQP